MDDLVKRMLDAYEKVAFFPERRMTADANEALGKGFLDLLRVRNLIPEAAARISALEEENKRLREGPVGNSKNPSIWVFDDAPAHYRELSTNGGDEDFLIFYPDRERGDVPYWVERMAVCDVDEFEVTGGIVYITSHA